MAEDALPSEGPEETARRGRPLWARILIGLGVFVVAIALLVAVAMKGLDTSPGHRFLADQIARLAPGSGLRIKIGRIEGSVYGRMTLRDVRLSDPQGVFLEIPVATIDWRPTAWFNNQLRINQLSAQQARFHRLPKLRPAKRKGPILPDFDIYVGSLRVHQLWLGPRLIGEPRTASLAAQADIRSGRVLLRLGARLLDGRDQLSLALDAEPDRDRFDLDAALVAPAKGALAKIAGFSQPLTVRIKGDGRWRQWHGNAKALFDSTNLADLELSMKAGRLALRGTARPAPFLKGKLQRLSSPEVAIDMSGMLDERKLDLTLDLRSSALVVTGGGVLDLGRNRFEGMKLAGNLLKPPALFPNMTGQDVRMRLAIDGDFQGPTVDYMITSPRVAFDETTFETARASGRADLSGTPKRIPVSFTARRVTGVGAEAEDILSNLKVDGPLFLQNMQLTSDQLTVTSDKVSGRLGLVLDLRTGRYAVDLLGTLARYLIPGIGIVDVETKLRAVPGTDRGTLLTGTARATVRRLDNGFFRSLTGGLPVVEANLTRTPDRVLSFSNLRLTSPLLRLTGQGLRRRDGTFQLTATGQHARYGPARISLDGRINRPQIDLVLANPDLGVRAEDVVARLDPTTEGWRFTARGQSILGPFTTQGRLVTPAGQPTLIDIAALDLSGGAVARGQLRALPGGLSGELAVSGNGLGGRLLLSPQNGIQRIEAHLTSNGTRFEGPPPIRIGRARLDGVALLYPDGPSIEGKLSGSGLRRGPVTLANLSAEASLRQGKGRVSATLSGRARTRFTFTSQADIAPGRITVTGDGSIEDEAIRLTEPARFLKTRDGWQLSRTTFTYAGGSGSIGGRFGNGLALEGDVRNVTLRVLDVLFPNLRLSGRASGAFSVEFPSKGRLPSGRANLTLKGLSRAGLVFSSAPIDVGIAAVLEGRKGAARAVIKSNGKVVGRGQARLEPIPGDADDAFADRMWAAPLFAQLRYNGPGDSLWRMIGVEAVDVTGPLEVAADFGGRLGEPTIKGIVRTSNGRIASPLLGTAIENLKASGRFDGSQLVIPSFTGSTPKAGTVSGRARFDLAAVNGFGMDIAIEAKNARLLNRDDIRADVTGPLTIRSDGSGGTVSGNVKIDGGRFRLGRPAAAEVPRLTVREINRPPREQLVDERPRKPWRLDIKADARNRLMVTGMGLDSEWRAKLDIEGAADRPQLTGVADLVRGSYEFAGKRFDLERGQIRFTGDYPPDPLLDIVAEASVQGLTATIKVSGTGLRPEINFASVPALPEDEVLSRILFGTSIANLSAPEALQLAAAVATIRSGGAGAGNPLNRLGRAVGIDRLRILPGTEATGKGPSFAAGKYIGKRVYVEVSSDTQGNSATSIEVELTRWLSVLSRVSTLGETSVNVRVSKDY